MFVFSLGDLGHRLLGAIEQRLSEGRPLPTDAPLSGVIERLPVILRPIAMTRYADNIGWSRWFYGGDDFPCLQLFWPDAEGQFPWEVSPDDPLALAQPDLSVRGTN